MPSFAVIDHRAIFLGILCGGSALVFQLAAAFPLVVAVTETKFFSGNTLTTLPSGSLGQAITRVGNRCQSGSEPETERQVVISEGREISTDWTDRQTRWRNAS
ncbi:hypothetical protein FIBSPDRAFT_878008 [Athelia psychrophila]|uniref:Uncharacterized protein n=1 Tax=Athelia psychrophila TaxID=1759441 RepID=A0A167VF71_9AGAM|nr:hypothetical protein FIBSPDRAFT_878008 [Fibularhizoctonia sp. CBS 109695]